ncbi:MAG: flagellar hook-length control protein FliK [Armatimonadetes bacterium]|nr:flagellar hook-length control protein FliK [Armatimonadota bacterium]
MQIEDTLAINLKSVAPKEAATLKSNGQDFEKELKQKLAPPGDPPADPPAEAASTEQAQEASFDQPNADDTKPDREPNPEIAIAFVQLPILATTPASDPVAAVQASDSLTMQPVAAEQSQLLPVAGQPLLLDSGREDSPVTTSAEQIAQPPAGDKLTVRAETPVQIDSSGVERSTGQKLDQTVVEAVKIQSVVVKSQAEASVPEKVLTTAASTNSVPNTTPETGSTRLSRNRTADKVTAQTPESDETQLASQPGDAQPVPVAIASEQAGADLSEGESEDTEPDLAVDVKKQPISAGTTSFESKVPAERTTPQNLKTDIAIAKPLEQVTEKLDALLTQHRTGSVRIVLQPAELGQVTVTVKSVGPRFEAEISVANDQVKSNLEASRGQFIQHVQSKGFTVGSIEISQQTSGFQQQQPGQHQSQETLTQTDFARQNLTRSDSATQATLSVTRPAASVEDGIDLII